ncbi:MAG: signal peptidase I [Dehalococcoidales bacterium]|nr:signal peptidase I [Dehalococcoidales bacterium]
MKAFLRDVLTTFLLAALVYFGLRFTVQDFVVRQSSMEPNFHEGQRVLVVKVVYRFHAPERGDVIILHPPLATNPDAIPFIKRIIGLPGESVDIRNGEVRINGIKLKETYLNEPPNYTYHLDKVPDNQYFVLGDNRANSDDSHRGWTVPRENVVGKAWLTIWPLDRWGLVSNFGLSAQVSNATSPSQ